VMDQLRTLEFAQLQAFARVLQQKNQKYKSISMNDRRFTFFSSRSQATIDKLRQQTTRLPPAQLISESIRVNSKENIQINFLFVL